MASSEPVGGNSNSSKPNEPSQQIKKKKIIKKIIRKIIRMQ